jgi:hypothetical protein
MANTKKKKQQQAIRQPGKTYKRQTARQAAAN